MSTNEKDFCENLKKQLSVEKSPLDLQITECDGDFFGPALPPHFSKINSESEEKETVYGPSLPNRFIDKLNEVSPSISKRKANILIGPEIPKHLTSKLMSPEREEDLAPTFIEDVHIGPSTTLMASEDHIGYYKFLNTQNLHHKTLNVSESNLKRESWMVELPEKRRANFGLLRRHFKPQTHIEKESDDSVWTNTLANQKKKETDVNKNDHNEILKVKRLEERDKEIEKLAKKAAKRLKNEKSLLEIHLKKMKKKKRKESKKQKKERILLPERRPFDRNVDLQICKNDESRKRIILNKSQFLKDRFASGQSRFL